MGHAVLEPLAGEHPESWGVQDAFGVTLRRTWPGRPLSTQSLNDFDPWDV